VFVNNLFFNRYGLHYGHGLVGGISGTTAWAHDPAHRLGAGYPSGQLSSRFGAASQAARVAAGRSGNWHSFGEGNIGGGAAGYAGARSSGAGNSFLGSSVRGGVRGVQSYGFQSSVGRAPSYQAPQRSFQAPQRSFQSAPRMSAPSFGGGGSRSYGGGGVSHGGGGGHGGGRR
jgi:hypothetical protein